MELWAGCIASALSDQDYRDKLRAAGFQQIGIEETRVYDAEAAKSFIESAGLDYEAIAAAVDGAFLSAFVRAVKPSA
jgi:hypothetical protein